MEITGDWLSGRARRVQTGISHGTGGRWAIVQGALLLAGVLASGCAAPGADINLAPLVTRISTATDSVETEALGGFILQRVGRGTGSVERLSIRPLFEWSPTGEDAWKARFLVPFGYSNRQGEEKSTILVPVFVKARARNRDGDLETNFAGLPGLIWSYNETDGLEVGWFPIFGRLENFLTYDRIYFVLWPGFIYAERDGKVSYHFLYPVFGWTRGGGETSHRVWPIYGRSSIEGRYDRRFFLWPFIHYHRDFLGGRNEEPATTWMVLPIAGHSKRGSFRAYTFLWPFFGYAHDPRSDFRALDAPWPLIRLQRGGPGDPPAVRTRFWPLYSYTKADGLEARSWLWPIIQKRLEVSARSERSSFHVVPFWQSWDRIDRETGDTSSWRKLWPLFQAEKENPRQGPAWSRFSFPTFDPFWRNDLIDHHYGWLWKAFEVETSGEMRRERSWLGLWRRERDGVEDRKSIGPLWAQRTYEREGVRTVETSLLFGLLRWRKTEGRGFAMLSPALPGPGWPARQ